MSSTPLPVRQFRCRLEELNTVSDLVQAMFTVNQADFSKASPDYAAPGYLTGWNNAKKGFADLVPVGVRKATDKEVTKEMNALAKSLRDPLNWLNIRLNRAEGKQLLANAPADFGLGQVRHEISTRDVEGLDGALNTLLQLVQEPKNLVALTAQGHTPADTLALADARARIAKFNETQNTNQDASLALTEQNIAAGNALWHYVGDALNTGALMYKETAPKKAKTFAMASLLKRMRNEGGKATAAAPAPGV